MRYAFKAGRSPKAEGMTLAMLNLVVAAEDYPYTAPATTVDKMHRTARVPET
jgi:hypothetical protein